MSLTIDGNSLIFDGIVTVSNFNDPTNGVCTLTLTPSGGVGTLPAFVNGDPGMPALITTLTITTLDPGEPATGSLDLTNPGGAGVSSEYALTLNIPQGATGDVGTFDIGDAGDLSGSPVVGDTVRVTGTSPLAFAYSPIPFGQVFNTTTISNVSQTGQTTGSLGSISIPAQPCDWYPLCFAKARVVGTTNTIVNLVASLNDGFPDGDIVGRADSEPGVANQKLIMIPSFDGLISSGYGKVNAGDTAVIYLQATEIASTSDSWTISLLTASFTVIAMPIASP